MNIEECEKLLEMGKILDNVHTKMGGTPSQMLPAIEFLLSEVKKWKQGCQDLAEEQDRLETEVQRFRGGIMEVLDETLPFLAEQRLKKLLEE